MGADWPALLTLAKEARAAREGDIPETARARSAERRVGAVAALVQPLAREVYAPLIERMAEGSLVIAQVGQSLDGRIATLGGHSHYVNGEAALAHLHRLRALVDGVIVGASTVVLDDPQLTTRRVEGPSPVRIVLDPRGRVPATARMFAAHGESFAVRSAAGGQRPADPRDVVLPLAHGAFPPRAVLDALAERGLRSLLIEGGGVTISAFLQAGHLDRLHVMLAPMLIGPGREAFRLPPIEKLDAARRFRMAAYPLGADVLLDCDLRPAP